MCGFIGWFQSKGSLGEERRAELSRALDLISHRGPDDGSEAASGEGDRLGWYMGFRRLAIQDLSPAGRQPMQFGGGRYTLTFNGEIYNHHELRHAELKDAALPSTGDTVVLGTLLAQKRPEQVLSLLRGMFAFAWWDSQEQALVAARDHFGIKPLYYCELDGTLVLSSEIKVMRHLLGDRAVVSQAALAQYFRWGSVQGPDTMLEGVCSLPPGHLLRWKDGGLSVERHFIPQWPGKDSWVSDPAQTRKLVRKGVTESVRAHLISDVPVGVFLSGGLDSTLMAAIMREQGMTGIQAFSIGYEENAGVPDESDTASRTAAFLGCKFTRERLTADGLFDKLDPYLSSLDQPTGDALNTWLVSQVAAREVKVTLSGLGADEWFGGYNYHRLINLALRVPAHASLGRVAGPLVKLAGKLLPAGVQGHKSWKALLYASGAAGTELAAMHAHARTIFNRSEIAALLRIAEAGVDAISLRNGLRDALISSLSERAPDAWLHQLLLLETETYLANTLLRDNDVTSMAHSLELRVPLVDREIFGLAGRISPDAKLNMQGGKRILREAFADLLPEWIARDTAKKTFTLPLMKWMRQPRWKERIMDTLTSRVARDRGWLDATEVERHLKRYYAATVEDKRAWRLSQTVWLMFVLESWARTGK